LWSSYPATVGAVTSPSRLSTHWLLSQFAKTRLVAHRRYPEFVAQGRNLPSLWPELKGQVLLGSETLVAKMRPPVNPPKHFSMIRGFHLADCFTLANAACGVASVFFAMIYVGSQSAAHFFAAAAMAPAALIFDVLDGRVARWRRQHSALGRELDSLADVISFGVAPAALAFAAGMRGGWDWIRIKS